MSNNLTPEQIKAILHLHHTAPVWFPRSNEYSNTTAGDWTMGNPFDHYLANNFKFGLTPLSGISDQHAIQVAFKNGLPDGYEVLNVEGAELHDWICVEYIKKENAEGEVRSTRYITFSELPDWQAQRLRELGYATPLDFGPGHPDNGKDAIALGLAVDRTTINVAV